MAQWRRFERSGVRNSAVEFREIRREGIRCLLRWSVAKDKVRAGTSVFDDDEHARRHEARKAAEWISKGFVEVNSASDDAAPDTGSQVLDVIRASVKYGGHPGFTPVPGFEETYHCELAPGHPLSHHNYYVLCDQGRSAIGFNVRADAHDDGAVAAFLEFVTAHRDLPFNGSSHHKVPLPRPAGSFSHALFCAPALGRSHVAFPAIARRVALAFPVFDCEIGDADTEVLVDARIHGHGSITYTCWNREPRPVVDLRFDIQASPYRPARSFLVFRPSDLESLLRALPDAVEGSWLEARNHRGEIRRFTPETAPAYPDAMAFLST